MRWRQSRRSENVEDRRGARVPGGLKTFGGLGVIIALVGAYFGLDLKKFLPFLGQLGQGGGQQQAQAPRSPEEEQLAEFVSHVLGDTEDVWNNLFPKYLKRPYEEPTLVMFTDQVQSGCGTADAGMGPFYCPADRKVYIDLAFYDTMKKKLGAPGDFAQAYVIAHEVGHHIQTLLGTSQWVHQQKASLSDADYNQLSVRLELQADFFAGVWAHHAQRARDILEKGDIEEAMNAADAIGDDRLQRQSRGYVQPESFTHGTSAQRVRWFRRGLETGDLSQGDTFKAREL